MSAFLSGGGASEAEEAEVRKLVSEAAKPEGYPDFELTFGEDSTGDPAVWIWFLIDRPNEADEARLASVRRLRKRIDEALFAHQIGRIHYIRYREAHPRKADLGSRR
jgi:hypothetical protein